MRSSARRRLAARTRRRLNAAICRAIEEDEILYSAASTEEGVHKHHWSSIAVLKLLLHTLQAALCRFSFWLAFDAIVLMKLTDLEGEGHRQSILLTPLR